MVITATEAQADQRAQALESLCRIYWYPLYSYIRRRGNTHTDAEDLTQAFFIRFLDERFLSGIRPEMGRFRSYVLVCLKNFLINQHTARTAQKRGGQHPHVSWDSAEAEKRYQSEKLAAQTPDRAYERQWALSILAKALAELEQEQQAAGKAERFAVLRQYLTDGVSTPPYAQIAAELDMSVGAVRVAVHRLRERYAHFLREEVLRTLHKPEDLEEEIAALFSALSV